MALDPTAADIPARAGGPLSAAEPDSGGDGDGGAGAEGRAGQPRSATACWAPSTRRCRKARTRVRRAGAARAAAAATRTSRRPSSISSWRLDRADRPARSERAGDARAALRPQRRLRQGDSAADRPGQPGTRLAGRPVDCSPRRTPAPGKTTEAIAWLEERAPDDPRLLPTLARLLRARTALEGGRGDVRARACSARRATRELKARYASALLNAGGRENITKARDVLTEAIAARPTAPDARALYLLSQAQRRLGDFTAAEATARRVIAQNSKSPWGYYALAEALEERRQYQAIVDALAPVVAEFRGASARRAVRRQHPPAASRLRVPGAGAVRQGDRGVRGSAPAVAERSGGRRLPDRGEPRREEVRRRRRGRASRRCTQHPDDLRLHAAAGAGAAAQRQARSGHRRPRGGGEEAQPTSRWPTSRWRRSTRTPTAARRP